MLEQYSKTTQETAKNLRIIDDAFFRLIAEKPDVCKEIIVTLLELPIDKVVKVTAQNVVQSLHREITLDALCLLKDGTYCNIEMQKGDNNDDIARTRFHAAAITSKYTPKGTDFKDIPNVTILYITEYDALSNGRTITHVSRCMDMGDGDYIPINDGEDIIFANTCINDGTEKSELLQLMLSKESFYNDKFPAISNAMKYFKDTEGGQAEVCRIIEDYANTIAEQRAGESREKGQNDLVEAIKALRSGSTPEQLSKMGYDEKTIELATVCK